MENVDAEGFGSAMLDSFTIDISHQEMERIIVELELLHKTQPAKWLPIQVGPVKSQSFPHTAAAAPSPTRPFTDRDAPRDSQGICNMLAEELGYEDVDEFEDALKAPFKVFLANLPHVEVRHPRRQSLIIPDTFIHDTTHRLTISSPPAQVLERQESELQPGLFRDVFRVIPDPPPEECKPQRLECVLSSRPDLWRVLMLHPGAMAEIPELEFEIGADHKRRVDSIYNHIGGAIFNLERHVEMLGEDGEQASRERQGIMDVCDELRKVLDMEGGPYTLVVTDPGGLSAFKPPTGVKVTALEQTTQYDRAARALAVAEEDAEGGDESDDSDDESAELLAAALADMKTGDECDVTPKRDGGVMKKVTKVGEGTERPGKGAEVAVHYVGTLTDGTKFDSSVDRGKPIEFTLGIGQVIKGWDLGIGSMRKGEKATLTIAPEYGYGDAGAGGVIPGGATLLFDVELVEWK